MDDNSVILIDENGEELKFEILGNTKLENIDYYLVGDEDNVYIMQDNSKDDEDLCLEFVEDEEKLSILLDLFNDILDDTEIIL